MSKLGLRIGATVATLFAAGAVGKFVSTGSQIAMNSAAVDQLRDSDAAYMQFSMLQWLMQSGWTSFAGFVVVLVILFFIWKGQFKNAQE
jgi:hypothetical protein